MLELNREYTAKELAQYLGITYKAFGNRKDKYLANLSLVANFEVRRKGPSQIYIITDQWEEYLPLSKSQQNIQFIRNKLKSDILIQPDGSLQTAANIGEILAEDLKLKPQTAAKYASTVLKQYYGENCGDSGEDGSVDNEKVWAFHEGHTWQTLPQDLLSRMIQEYNKLKEANGLGTEAELCAFEDEEESGFKYSGDKLQAERFKLWNRIKREICIEKDYRWIMRVKKYLVHDFPES